MTKPKLLDLFCGSGGAGVGYARAGFEVTGIDIAPKPDYPFRFIQGDIMRIKEDFLCGFDAIHASPPCQAFTKMRNSPSLVADAEDLVEAVRSLLRWSERLYVIENVVGAPLVDTIMLCGSSFGLDVQRHRLFEANFEMVPPPCNHSWQTPRFKPSSNRTNLRRTVSMAWRIPLATQLRAMDVDWVNDRRELSQMVPPRYTQWIGNRMMEVLDGQP